MSYLAGFLGCGNMGGTLARCAASAVGGKSIAVCDRDEAKTQAIANEYGAAVLDAQVLALQSQFLFLGVKPQVLAAAVAEIAPALKENSDVVLVTMAAGVETDTIRAMLAKEGFTRPIIRIMPNTPAAVGEGMILYSAGSDVAKAQVQDFLKLLQKAGRLTPLPEAKIDAGCALSGSGPAFVYLFIEALADGGVECGLTREQATTFAAQTALGAAKMVLEKGDPAALKNAVCSPGGTTIAGIHALEADGFRAAAMDAVAAAYDRALELKEN